MLVGRPIASLVLSDKEIKQRHSIVCAIGHIGPILSAHGFFCWPAQRDLILVESQCTP